MTSVDLKVDSYVANLLDDAFSMYLDSRKNDLEGFEALLGLMHYSDAEYILFTTARSLVHDLDKNKKVLTPLDLEEIFERCVSSLEGSREKVMNVIHLKKETFINIMKDHQVKCINNGIFDKVTES